MRHGMPEVLRATSVIFLVCAFFLSFAVSAAFGSDSEFRWKSIPFAGLDVHYIDEGPSDAPIVLFIHGWSCDASFWRFQIPELRESYRVVVVDLPGFGRSGKPRDRAYTLDLFAEAVYAVLEAEELIAPVLVGHSMGYAVARHFLLRRPGFARAVVNVDGAYFRPPAESEALEAWKAGTAEFARGFSSPEREEVVRTFVESTFYGRTPEALRVEILSKMLAADEYVSASAMEEFVKAEYWEERFFDLPLLAIYARTDFLPPYQEDYLRSIYRELTYEVWEDTGHFPMMETPDRFNETLKRFLERLSE